MGVTNARSARSISMKNFMVTLTGEERSRLRKLVTAGKAPARTLMHARWHLEACAENNARVQKALDDLRACLRFL